MKQFVVVTDTPTNKLPSIDDITELLSPIMDKVECIEYSDYKQTFWWSNWGKEVIDFGYKISLCNDIHIVIDHKRKGTWTTQILHTNAYYEDKNLIISFAHCILMHVDKLLKDAEFLNKLTSSVIDGDYEKYITQSKLGTIDINLFGN